MTEQQDIEYLSRRAKEERAKADNAADPVSYHVHTQFARGYERKVLALIANRKAEPIEV